MSAAEIHRELCSAVHDQNVMSEGTVRQWCRMFRHGSTNVHDEERSGRSPVVSDELVQNGSRRFTISELSREFPQISPIGICEIITAG
jgi:transposase